MSPRYPFRALLLLLFVPVALGARVVRDEAPLKSWQAPLYWQPTEAENPNGKEDATSARIPLVFVGITPCRVVDTRVGQGFTGPLGPPSLAGSASRTFPIRSSAACTLPSIAQAYSLNITMSPRGYLGVLKIYPTGQSLPLVETVSSTQGFIVDNAAVVPAGAGGSIEAYASAPTDLVIDINGYYIPAIGLSLTPDAGSELARDPSAGRVPFSSQAKTLNLAGGEVDAVASSPEAKSPMGKSLSVNGLKNSITATSPNEIYIGGDNGSGSGPANPFSNIRVGIGTTDVSGDSKVKIFGSGSGADAPALEVTTPVGKQGARLQLAVAPCTGCYSTVATPGDAILGAKSGASKDLILSATNGHQGSIRFTTGKALSCGTLPGVEESQKMVLTTAGNLGIGPNFETSSCALSPQVPVTARLDVDGVTRIRSLPRPSNLNDVVVVDKGGVLFTRDASTFSIHTMVKSQATSQAGAGAAVAVQAVCTGNTHVVGGGYRVTPEVTSSGQLIDVRILASYPVSSSIWEVRSAGGPGQGSTKWTLEVWALCEG
ncbi:MAG: hypothetical protein ACJ76N_23070 [Thermoanaerobaculia bacterium]